MNDEARTNGFNSASIVRAVAVWGPGLLVMLADTDAGNVVTAAQGGALWGYRLLPLILALIPMLYLVQELTARLGVYTGRGHAELIRERYGLGWALVAVAGLAAAAIGSLVTEFTGVAGIGEMFGLPRSAHPADGGGGAARDRRRGGLSPGGAGGDRDRPVRTGLLRRRLGGASEPRGDGRATPSACRSATAQFLYMVAAIIGATFNPWMIFYQQSATVDKSLQPADLRHARIDTAIGAVLTQCLTGAVLIAAAATFAYGAAPARLASVGEISGALTPSLGAAAGKVVFGAGVLGASLVAAIVASLALAWGVGEIAGYRRALELHPFAAGWFYGVYALCVVGSAFAVWTASDLVWLNVAAQVLNAFLMPLVIGFLVGARGDGAARALSARAAAAALHCRDLRRRPPSPPPSALGSRPAFRAPAASLAASGAADARPRRPVSRNENAVARTPASKGVGSDQKIFANLRRIHLVRPVPLEAHLPDLAQERREEPHRRKQGRRQRPKTERDAERIRRHLQDLARRPRRRTRHVPGLTERRIGRVEQGRRGAGDVRHIGVVVRDVGRADEERGLALGQRADRRIAEIGPGDVRPVEIGRAQRRDRAPGRCRSLHPDRGSRRTGRPASRHRRSAAWSRGAGRSAGRHVEIVDEHHPRAGRLAGGDEIADRLRPGFAPHLP